MVDNNKITISSVGVENGVKLRDLRFDLSQFDLDPKTSYRVLNCKVKKIYLDKDKVDEKYSNVVFTVLDSSVYDTTYNALKKTMPNPELMIQSMGFEIEVKMETALVSGGFADKCIGQDLKFDNYQVYPKWVSYGQGGSYSAVKVVADLATSFDEIIAG